MCAVFVHMHSAGPYSGWQKEIEYFELCDRHEEGVRILGVSLSWRCKVT